MGPTYKIILIPLVSYLLLFIPLISCLLPLRHLVSCLLLLAFGCYFEPFNYNNIFSVFNKSQPLFHSQCLVSLVILYFTQRFKILYLNSLILFVIFVFMNFYLPLLDCLTKYSVFFFLSVGCCFQEAAMNTKFLAANFGER